MSNLPTLRLKCLGLSPMWSPLSFSKEDDCHEFSLSAYLCCRFLRNPQVHFYVFCWNVFHSSLVTSKVLWLKFFEQSLECQGIQGHCHTTEYEYSCSVIIEVIIIIASLFAENNYKGQRENIFNVKNVFRDWMISSVYIQLWSSAKTNHIPQGTATNGLS